MPTPTVSARSQAAALLGSLGGRAGSRESKQAAQRASVRARLANAAKARVSAQQPARTP